MHSALPWRRRTMAVIAAVLFCIKLTAFLHASTVELSSPSSVELLPVSQGSEKPFPTKQEGDHEEGYKSHAGATIATEERRNEQPIRMDKGDMEDIRPFNGGWSNTDNAWQQKDDTHPNPSREEQRRAVAVRNDRRAMWAGSQEFTSNVRKSMDTNVELRDMGTSGNSRIRHVSAQEKSKLAKAEEERTHGMLQSAGEDEGAEGADGEEEARGHKFSWNKSAWDWKEWLIYTLACPVPTVLIFTISYLAQSKPRRMWEQGLLWAMIYVGVLVPLDMICFYYDLPEYHDQSSYLLFLAVFCFLDVLLCFCILPAFTTWTSKEEERSLLAAGRSATGGGYGATGFQPDGQSTTRPHSQEVKYSWDAFWWRTGQMLFGLQNRLEEAKKERHGAALPDVSKMSIEEVAQELDFVEPLDPSLSVWTAAATLEESLERLRRGGGCSERDVIERSLHAVLQPHMLWAAVFYSLGMLCSLAIPLCCYGLLLWTEADNPSQALGFGCVAGILLASLLAALCKELFVDRCNVMGLWTMSAACGLVFKKVLRLPVANAFSTDVGQVIELMSGSADALVGYWGAVMGLWLQSIEIILLLALLTFFVGSVFNLPCPIAFLSVPIEHQGWAAVAGMGVVLVALSVVRVGGQQMEESEEERRREAEGHSQKLIEMLGSMKAIKYNAWEPQFESRIRTAKLREMDLWTRTGRWLALINTASNPSIDVISLAVVAMYTVVLGNTLKPSTLGAYFVVLALIHGKIFELPENVRAMTDGAVALTRLQEFLDQDQLARADRMVGSEGGDSSSSHGGRGQPAVRMERAAFAWSQGGSNDEGADMGNGSLGEGEQREERDVLLRDVEWTVPVGALVGMSGEVGSGKSTLLLAILQELPPSSGRVRLHPQLAAGKVAYAPQAAWAFAGSVRDNIVLDNAWDEEWYATVCEACALPADFRVLPDGDLTMLGERGTNLSGGQRQRVSLARATYARAPLVLLDDVVSALDAQVREHVWKHCILGLMRGATRIVVSHDAAKLQLCDQVVEIQDGGVAPAEPAASLHVPEEAVSERNDRLPAPFKSEDDNTGKELAAADPIPGEMSGATEKRPMEYGHKQRTETLWHWQSAPGPDGEQTGHEEGEQKQQLATDAGRDVWSFVWHLLQGAGGLWMGAGLVGLWCVEGATVLAGLVMMTLWTEAAMEDEQAARAEWRWYLGAYLLLVVGEQASSMLRNLGWVVGTRQAVLNLHARMLHVVLHAPVTSLAQVKSGALAHRFAAQLSKLDMQVMVASDLFLYGVGFAIIITVVSCALIYWLLLVALAAVAAVEILTNIVEGGRHLRHLRDRLRPTLVEHSTSTMYGVASVRAFKAEKLAEAQMQLRVDAYTRANLAGLGVDSWLKYHSMLVASLYFAATGMGIVLHAQGHGLLAWAWEVKPSEAALVVTWLCFGSFCAHTFVLRKLQLQSLARTRASLLRHVEQSVEVRLQMEGPYEDGEGDSAAGADWPRSGEVEFRDVVLRYPGSAQPAVDGLSWMVQSGQKCAVVGRTGAGKTTLVSAMTRMVPLESGTLLIGGVDIAGLGLRKLRQAVSVVSQEPVMFAGSIRDNLDPFVQYSDAALWEVLDGGGMRELVNEKGGLEAEVAELGANLSVGERQLLAVARGLLRRCRVLLLDEATGSLDEANEDRVLRVVHTVAQGATVVHVAHRLTTLRWCNRVLVMGHGKMLEQGSPAGLVADPNSHLSAMLRGGNHQDVDSGRLRAELLQRESSAAERAT